MAKQWFLTWETLINKIIRGNLGPQAYVYIYIYIHVVIDRHIYIYIYIHIICFIGWFTIDELRIFSQLYPVQITCVHIKWRFSVLPRCWNFKLMKRTAVSGPASIASILLHPCQTEKERAVQSGQQSCQEICWQLIISHVVDQCWPHTCRIFQRKNQIWQQHGAWYRPGLDSPSASPLRW